jgi:hypothetical protein
MGRRAELPDAVRATLHALFGAGVDAVVVVENSWFVRWHARAVATTRRRRIYLRGTAAEFFDDPVLMLHEYFHVLAQWEPRRLTTWRYVLESLRRGYWQNCFEVEARAFVDANLHRFHALHARTSAAGSMVSTNRS